METNAAILAAKTPMTIYNCSEGGILGVLKRNDQDYEDSSSWYLYDEVLRGKWRTRKLKDALREFLLARQELGIRHAALDAAALALPN
jgi:hypothetical protein